MLIIYFQLYKWYLTCTKYLHEQDKLLSFICYSQQPCKVKTLILQFLKMPQLSTATQAHLITQSMVLTPVFVVLCYTWPIALILQCWMAPYHKEKQSSNSLSTYEISGSFWEPTEMFALNPHNNLRSDCSYELHSTDVEMWFLLELEFKPRHYDL